MQITHQVSNILTMYVEDVHYVKIIKALQSKDKNVFEVIDKAITDNYGDKEAIAALNRAKDLIESMPYGITETETIVLTT